MPSVATSLVALKAAFDRGDTSGAVDFRCSATAFSLLRTAWPIPCEFCATPPGTPCLPGRKCKLPRCPHSSLAEVTPSKLSARASIRIRQSWHTMAENKIRTREESGPSAIDFGCRLLVRSIARHACLPNRPLRLSIIMASFGRLVSRSLASSVARVWNLCPVETSYRVVSCRFQNL